MRLIIRRNTVSTNDKHKSLSAHTKKKGLELEKTGLSKYTLTTKCLSTHNKKKSKEASTHNSHTVYRVAGIFRG